MAHSLSAKKRIRQSLKRRARNRARKVAIKDQVKAFSAALASDMTKAEVELRKVVKVLDQVSAKGTIHKNAASRRRSRLTKRLNAARKAAGAGAGGGTAAATA